jgi:hypothetical protein
MSDWSSPAHDHPRSPRHSARSCTSGRSASAGLRVEARVFEHVLGVELRILEAGELRRSQVYLTTEGADQDARNTYARLADPGA